MKKVISFCLFTIISINFIYAQDYELIEVGKSIKFGDKKAELGKNLQFKSEKALGFSPDGIAVDIDNSFYVCDKFSKTIIKYDSLMNYIYEIKIEDSNLHGEAVKGFNKTHLTPVELSYKVELATDTYKNLYCLIKKDDRIHRFIKYNEEGKLIKEFDLHTTLPAWFNANMFHINNDKIFIYTSIELPPDKSYTDFMQKNVFVYDLEGGFLGRCNYFLEDDDGKIYRRNTINKKDLLWIDQYSSELNNIVKPTSELSLNRSLYTELQPNTGLDKVEIDKHNNLYFISLNPLLIAVFNFNDNTVKKVSDIEPLREVIYKKYKILVPTFKSLLVSYNGNIFIYGIKSKKDYSDRYKESNDSEVELRILQIKPKEEIINPNNKNK